ncbi:MAG: insulinase family protein [bacterium]|nr:insulinase family protein [bacterium]
MQLPNSFKSFAQNKASQRIAEVATAPCVFYPYQDSPFSYIMAAIKAGVRYESQEDWGASHFLEHILMRSTEKYATLYELSRHVEGIGGQTSAYSTRDLTAYWVKVPTGCEELGLDLLSQILFKPTLKQEFIDLERSIIVHERQRELVNYGRYTANALESLLLEPNPMSRHPVGTDESLARMTPDYLRAFLKKHYHAGNIVVVGAGQPDPSFAGKVEAFLKEAPPGETSKPANFMVESQYPDGSVIIKRSPHKEQVFISMGWRFPVLTDLDLLTWRVINTLLGAGYTSLLNWELREKHSFTYVCNTAMNVYDGMGVFKLHMAMHDRDLPQALGIVTRIIADLASNKIDRKAFDEAVVRHAAGLVTRWQNPLEAVPLVAHLLSRDGRLFDLAGYLSDLEKVKMDRAAELVSRWLAPQDRLVFVCTGSDKVDNMFAQTYRID